MCGPYTAWHNDPPPHFINWSPDGTHLIFDDITSVQLVDVNGTRLRQIVDANPGYRFREGIGPFAQFSPDGQAIVYASCEFSTDRDAWLGDAPRDPRGDYKFEIATVGVDGTGGQRRTTDSYYDHLPVWSPDGRRIAYLSAGHPFKERSLNELYVLSVGAADVDPVALVRDLYVAAPPQWAPDGTQLAVLGLRRRRSSLGDIGVLLKEMGRRRSRARRLHAAHGGARGEHGVLVAGRPAPGVGAAARERRAVGDDRARWVGCAGHPAADRSGGAVGARRCSALHL